MGKYIPINYKQKNKKKVWFRKFIKRSKKRYLS